MEAHKFTHRDTNQIVTAEHDEHLNAKRVIIIGGELNPVNINNKTPELKIEKIEIPVIVKELEIKELEKPVILIQKELQVEKIEIPTIIKELEVKYIDRPIIVKEFEKIEVPVIVKEQESKDLPKWLQICVVAQMVTTIIMLLKK